MTGSYSHDKCISILIDSSLLQIALDYEIIFINELMDNSILDPMSHIPWTERTTTINEIIEPIWLN